MSSVALTSLLRAPLTFFLVLEVVLSHVISYKVGRDEPSGIFVAILFLVFLPFILCEEVRTPLQLLFFFFLLVFHVVLRSHIVAQFCTQNRLNFFLPFRSHYTAMRKI